uniref:Tryptophan aminotransferase n=1 Tax=Solanum tuberosum TaxID=4113 RepID=M1CU84_SOLTU
MYESYWRKKGNKCDITFNGDDSLSYFANGKSLCWFLESKLEEQITRLHNVVGNAIVDDHYTIVGTGSSQLMQAAVYALSPTDQLEPISAVSATPFYSAYPEVTDFVREPVVNGDQGKLIYDLAYYWPQYTAITIPANHDVMLFTISKCTGHAGSRIGWKRLRQVVTANELFVLQTYPLQYCLFTKDFCESHTVEEEDCEKLLKEHKIHTRSGRRFGSDSSSVRISMLSRDEDFNIFLERLMVIQGPTNGIYDIYA